MVNIKDSSLNFLNKNIFSYLISLYGIGKFRAKYICKSLNLNYFIKVKFLCDKTLFKISKIISNFNVFESLKKFNKDNIDKLISINCYRGIRHKKNLPVRGQNTKNNARTRKGLKKNILFKKSINNVFKGKKKGKKNNKIQKKNKLKVKTIAHIHIFSSHNNTIITLTSKIGDTISWATSSSIGFKGCKKSIHYASQNASEKIGRTALNLGFKNVNLYIKGFGFGRDYALRGIFNSGIKVLSMHDITPIPHNGCKIKKIRRK